MLSLLTERIAYQFNELHRAPLQNIQMKCVIGISNKYCYKEVKKPVKQMTK